jgi:hypothetical protein
MRRRRLDRGIPVVEARAVRAPARGTSRLALERRRDELVLQLKGLVHVRALLETHGASTAELDAHGEEIARVRAELAGIAKADAIASAGGRR